MSEAKSNNKHKKRICTISIVSLILIVIAAVLVVIFVILIPQKNRSNKSNKQQQDKSNNNNDNKEAGDINQYDINVKPNLNIIPNFILDNLDDSKKCNEYTPPLNEPFDYKKYKIRGVNLGGWLVPEPFIVPSIFEDKVNKGVVDEWTLCELIGKKECSKRLLKHYDTFITEQDIKIIKEAGLNHIRIPIGYWMMDINEDEPFIYGSWYYLLKAINWCRKYGLRVMIDFHGAPGSQNGWNHSGRMGQVRFLNNTSSESGNNVKRFTDILLKVVTYFSKEEFKNVVTMIGILNEPAIFKLDQAPVLQFYKDTYNKITKINDLLMLVYHEGFIGLDKWKNKLPNKIYPNLIMDSHNYIMFDSNLIVKPKDEILKFPCSTWLQDFKLNSNPTICGEFSTAINDCAKWLNGINLGTRYEGTFEFDKPVCKNCTCENQNDYNTFNKEYKRFLLRFSEYQMDTFEQGIGWFFWTFKTENHVNPNWDYYLGIKEGWIPKDANNREYKCNDIIN